MSEKKPLRFNCPDPDCARGYGSLLVNYSHNADIGNLPQGFYYCSLCGRYWVIQEAKFEVKKEVIISFPNSHELDGITKRLEVMEQSKEGKVE